MKAITLYQPYATLIALGFKQYETRSWSTNYRGKLAIHAAKRPIDKAGWALEYEVFKLTQHRAPGSFFQRYGCIVAIADLTDCHLMRFIDAPTGSNPIWIDEISALEKAVGHWEPDHYAWKLDNVVALPEPIPARGRQGLWEWEGTP